MVEIKDLLKESPFIIMGILNVTKDSFYDGGKYYEVEKAVEHAFKLKEEGADIIDIGAESTRPFSEEVPLEAELEKIVSILEQLKKNNFNHPISVDTRKSKVAKCAIELGAEIINDTSGGFYDPQILDVVAEKKKYIVLMHIKGTPKDMQINPFYEDVIKEVKEKINLSIENAIKRGIKKDKIIIDPGIGFGKRVEDNLKIIKNLNQFASMGFPLLIGVSRKSFIGNILGVPVEERLSGSIAFNLFSFLQGAKIFRVHDVKETIHSLKCVQTLLQT